MPSFRGQSSEVFTRDTEPPRTVSGHLVASSRRFPTLSIHNLVECLEVCPSFPILKKTGRLEGGDFFGHGSGYKLVYAGAILLAQPLHCLLEGAWETQGICFCFRHFLILLIASFGRRTSIPKCEGTAPKCRALNVTKAFARPLTAASSTISSPGSRS